MEAVVAGGYLANANAEEKTIMGDLEKHERAHREFFKRPLGSYGHALIWKLIFSIDFNQRASVFDAAKTFRRL